MQLPAAPASICILRLSALGDVTHVLPLVQRLGEHWPGTHITWIIGKAEHRLLQGLQGVEFIVFDKRGGWPAIRALRQALKNRRFDLLLHMQVAARANLLSRLIKAPVRIGWNRERSRDLHHWFINRQVAHVPFQHQTEAFLEFANTLGLPAAPPRWNLPIEPAAQQWARAQVPVDQPLLVISPCSSHARRNWPAERHAAVADVAQQQLGMQVVLFGGPSQLEHETAAAIEQCMTRPCTNLVGKDTLEQSKAMLARADLLISPDSGPVHIASALGTPVLGLYAATWSRRSGPYNSLPLCVDRFAEAARRFRQCEPEALRWGTRIEEPGVMDLISVEDVIEKMRHWHAARQAESR